MQKLTTDKGVFGPYTTIEVLADRYRCDGADLPVTVVGTGAVADALPGDFPQLAPDPDQVRAAAKAARTIAVENIKVTTAAGNTFDGDETSQTRMARAILVLSTGAALSVLWVLADNTVIQADAAELAEALALAGAEQARLWVL